MERKDIVVPHRFAGPPRAATLEERENRFLARCRLETGEVVHAHVPDRGRLESCLVAGARVFLYAAPSPNRRTPWSLLVAQEPGSGTLVAIDPARANARVRALIDAGVLEGLGDGWSVVPERTIGDSRIDFLLSRGDERLAIEVKSVGLVENGIALFPDAPTLRGVRHLQSLVNYARSGQGRARVVFCVQRGDARQVGANARVDPLFAQALHDARADVELSAVGFDIALDGARYLGALPVRDEISQLSLHGA